MKIFISWSGDKSKSVAVYLKSWIEQIIQAAEPWISVDIDKGKKWNGEIIGELEDSSVGIICMTRDNLKSPWILFEAGALSKTSDSYVCTFLIDIIPTDITGPLSIFQATRFNKEDVHKLLVSINRYVKNSGGKALSSDNLKSLFNTFYPQLETEINNILSNSKEDSPKVLRTDRELLEETVMLLRKKNETPKSYIENEAKSLLNFYAHKYARAKGIDNVYEVGTVNYIDDFMNHIHDNPLLLKTFNSVPGIRSYVEITMST